MTPEPETIILYQSENLLVRHVTGYSSNYCAVTFAPFEHDLDPDRAGFGEPFFKQLQVDAVHIIPADNSWYQYPDLEAACAQIRVAVARYHRVLAYGTSMGGYGAMRFGGWVGAHTALAISPQSALAPCPRFFGRGKAWRDPVWRAQTKSIRFLHEDRDDFAPHAFVVYDPLTPDRRHAEFYRSAKDVTLIPVPDSGHPSMVALIQAGLLTPMISEICWGVFDADRFIREVGGLTAHTPQIAIIRAMRAKNPFKRLRLARAAIAAFPGDRSALRVVADAASRVGQARLALTAMEEILAAEPDFMGNHYLLHKVHFRAGRFDRAMQVLEFLVARPHHPVHYDAALKRVRFWRGLRNIVWPFRRRPRPRQDRR